MTTRRDHDADDDRFVRRLGERLARVPGVLAVTLGGSRALGEHGPDSDWDLGLYYRGHLDVDGVRALGWPGRVFPLGGWGGGVMNGGAWLTVDGRRVDLHYRDLDSVERRIAEAELGRFEIEWLLFHLAGVPTYLAVGELAISLTLAGELPRPGFPAALRVSAARRWREEARLTLAYVEAAHASRGDPLGCAGLLAQAVVQAAHGVLAARGEWALNEKRLVRRAGLGDLAGRFGRLGADPNALRATVEQLTAALSERGTLSP